MFSFCWFQIFLDPQLPCTVWCEMLGKQRGASWKASFPSKREFWHRGIGSYFVGSTESCQQLSFMSNWFENCRNEKQLIRRSPPLTKRHLKEINSIPTCQSKQHLERSRWADTSGCFAPRCRRVQSQMCELEQKDQLLLSWNHQCANSLHVQYTQVFSRQVNYTLEAKYRIHWNHINVSAVPPCVGTKLAFSLNTLAAKPYYLNRSLFA